MTKHKDPLALLRSPEVETTVKLILDTWKPTHGKKILLILPCSARKPYRESDSQQRYVSVSDSVPGGRESIEIVSLSGVFGIVPRQFEELPEILSYNLSLNRASDTKGKHREIVEILATRVARFLLKHQAFYSHIFFYGRERYFDVFNVAISKTLTDHANVIGSRTMQLKTEGLVKLRATLENAVASTEQN